MSPLAEALERPASSWDPMDWHPSDQNVDDSDANLWGLPRVLEEIWWRVEHGMDAIVLFDGEEGLGKSTAAITLAKMLQRGDPFSVDRVAFGVREMVQKMLAMEPGTVVQADEVVEGFQSRGAMSTENKLGQKWVQTCRDRHLILLIAYPSLWDLDIYLREHRVAFRVYLGWDRLGHDVPLPDGRVFRKGTRVRMAKIYQRGKNAWKREAYWTKRAQFIFDPLDDDPIYQAMKAKKRAYTDGLGQEIAGQVTKAGENGQHPLGPTARTGGGNRPPPAQLLKDLMAGKSRREMAEEYGKSPATIQSWLQDLEENV